MGSEGRVSRVVSQRRVAAGLVLVGVACAGWVALALRERRPEAVDWRAQLTVFTPRPSDDGNALVHPLSDGGRVELTLDAPLQRRAEQLLAQADAVDGAVVALSVADGRVLALAGRNRAEPDRDEPQLALRAWAPAASVFKLVTVSALLDAGVRPSQRVCYHGGLRGVEADNLEDHPSLDHTCRTLADALARSQNAVIGRLAEEHLDPPTLLERAQALGWSRAPALELPTGASQLSLPSEPLAFARVAAGFWQSTLSPLHGALLAALIARGGVTAPAHLVERVLSGDGHSLKPALPETRRVLSTATARALATMMVGTTERGSARHAFLDENGKRRLGAWRVAGKTGTLNGPAPFVAYTWFVGFAPAEQPEIAFAVLLGHDEEGRVRAAELGRDLVAAWRDRGLRTSTVAQR